MSFSVIESDALSSNTGSLVFGSLASLDLSKPFGACSPLSTPGHDLQEVEGGSGSGSGVCSFAAHAPSSPLAPPPPAEEESRTNLLVRYLHPSVDDAALRAHFCRYGAIATSIVQRDIHTGQSRGFGFVRYIRPTDAARAVAEGNGSVVCGKCVNVLWAKKEHDATPAGEDRQRMHKLFVRNLPLDTTKQEVTALLAPHGTVVRVNFRWDTAPDADAAHTRRIAFVTFAEPGAAERALRAVHNTCPFPSCRGVPLLAKLSEDYGKKRRSPASSAAPQAARPAHQLPQTQQQPQPMPHIFAFPQQQQQPQQPQQLFVAPSGGAPQAVPVQLIRLDQLQSAAPLVYCCVLPAGAHSELARGAAVPPQVLWQC